MGPPKRTGRMELVATVVFGAGGGLLLLAPLGVHGPLPETHSVPRPMRGRVVKNCAVLNHTFRLAPACDGFRGAKLDVYPLLVTGTGRAGTRFSSLSFKHAGYGVSHDDGRVGRDGAVSWPLALREAPDTPVGPDGFARTYELPNFARRWNRGLRGARPLWRFRRVFHQVRDPLRCVLSRANRVGMMVAPLAYSNPHLFRALGHAPGFPPPDELKRWDADRSHDVWTLDKRLRVALFHYTFWNDWVASYADYTFRVEDFDVADLAKRAGLASKAPRRSRRPPAHDVNSKPLDAALRNMTWADLERVSPFVWARATTLARGFGYDVN